MGFSRISYPFTGGTQEFEASFALGYLEADDVQVYVDGVEDGLGNPVPLAYTFITDTTVQVTDTLPNPCTVVLERTVDKNSLEIDLDNTGAVTRATLLRAFRQLMMNVHELLDGRVDSFTDITLIQQLAVDTQQAIADLDTIEQEFTDFQVLVSSAETAIQALLDGGTIDINALVALATGHANDAETSATSAASSAVAAQAAQSETLIAEIDVTTGAALRYDIPPEFDTVELRVTEFQPSNNSAFLAARLGTGGATDVFLSTAGVYLAFILGATSAGTVFGPSALSYIALMPGNNTHRSWAGTGGIRFTGLNSPEVCPQVLMDGAGVDGVPQDNVFVRRTRILQGADLSSPFNAIELFVTDGAVNHTFTRFKARLVGMHNG